MRNTTVLFLYAKMIGIGDTKSDGHVAYSLV